MDRLNQLPAGEACEELLKCCGSKRWAEAMVAQRPFQSPPHLFDRAIEVWKKLNREDWVEAFRQHPRIGDIDSIRKKFASTAEMATGEQKGVVGADDHILNALAIGNEQFERRFGHIFIVCATGKSALEMLHILQERLKNDPTTELQVAMMEQAKITQLRLEKLIQL
jgi:2-oxo-4-hydroxy-4-carboxy-5-ureidoimidazoline decarboxylase